MAAGVIYLVSTLGVSLTTGQDIGSPFSVKEHAVLRASVCYSAAGSKLQLKSVEGASDVDCWLYDGNDLPAGAWVNVSANLRPGVTYTLKNVGVTVSVSCDAVAVLAPVI